MTVDHPMTLTAKNIAFGSFSKEGREGLCERHHIGGFVSLGAVVKLKEFPRSTSLTSKGGAKFFQEFRHAPCTIAYFFFFSFVMRVVIGQLPCVIPGIPFWVCSQDALALSLGGVLAASILAVLPALSNPLARISSCDVGVFVRHLRTITGLTYYDKQFLCQGVI